MTSDKVASLETICKGFRRDLLEMLYTVQTGHFGGSLSSAEILGVLYFDKMKVDPQNPRMEGRDRFILSKGHGAPMLYLALAEKGFFPKSELFRLRQLGGMLQGHPCAGKTPGVDCSSGPLGLGLSVGVGMALAERRKQSGATIYVLLGDGEMQEGAVWEALMTASKYRLANLVGILDYNRVQLDGTTDEVMPMGDLPARIASFGWKTVECDGHSIPALSDALDEAKAFPDGPVMVIAHTVKGKGISFMEGKNIWHGKVMDPQEYVAAKQELEGAVYG